MPWRAPAGERTPPYRVWLSEIMLQQTQVARVEVAWVRFTGRFPTPAALATASVADAVRAWAGLGYNRRAVALHRAATAIIERHGGAVPDDLAALEDLPGVGPYTARAVTAIAFGRPVAAVDTNIRRVVGRVVAGHGWAGDPGLPLAASAIQAASDAMIDPGRPADWTHAAMDIGATVCRPRAPDCADCPLRTWCAFARSNDLRPQPRLRARPAVRPRPSSFAGTSRWLRGRIIDRLRELPDDGWMRFDDPIGVHSTERVAAAVAALSADGLLECDPEGRVRLPSPT